MASLRPTLLASLILLALAQGVGAATTLFSESFGTTGAGVSGTTTFPSGWTNLALPGSASSDLLWMRRISGGTGIGGPNNMSRWIASGSPVTGNFAIFDSDRYAYFVGGRLENGAIGTPSVNVAGYNIVTVEYDDFFKPNESIAGSPSRWTLQVSVDESGVWSTVATGTTAIGTGAGNQADPAVTVHERYDLSPWTRGHSTARARFVYQGFWDWYWIVDNVTFYGDTSPQVTIGSVSAAEGNSGSTSFQFPLTVTPGLAGPITLHYTTTAGSATSPADFAAVSGQLLTIPANETSANIVVSVVGDALREATESFSLHVDDISSSVTMVQTNATATILNDDPLPTGFAFGIDTLSTSRPGQPDGSDTIFDFNPATPAAGGDDIGTPTSANAYVSGDFIYNDFTSFYTINKSLGPALVRFDTSTGLETTIGPLSGLAATDEPLGMKWDGGTATMWLLGRDETTAICTLYRVNTSTGTCVPGVALSPSPTAPHGLIIRSADSSFYTVDTGTDKLVKFNYLTGAATNIGSLGVNISDIPSDGDYDDTGDVLYFAGWDESAGLINRWYTINRTSGIATLVDTIETSRHLGQTSAIGIARAYTNSHYPKYWRVR